MLCPYCRTEVHVIGHHRDASRHSYDSFSLFDPSLEREYLYEFAGSNCPKCKGAIVTYSKRRITKNIQADPNVFSDILFPKSASLKPLPSEVPQDYRKDFDEARLVFVLSPKSSAALGRRLLQRVLHERFSINRPNLQQEIQEFISALTPPTHLAQQLDAIRVVGNFAAHPIKDTNTGTITDVEEGEAKLLIETLESLFDYAFVQPAKWSAAKAAINAKLSAAGKPIIP
jgi:hypothetical protein